MAVHTYTYTLHVPIPNSYPYLLNPQSTGGPAAGASGVFR